MHYVNLYLNSPDLKSMIALQVGISMVGPTLVRWAARLARHAAKRLMNTRMAVSIEATFKIQFTPDNCKPENPKAPKLGQEVREP